MISTAPSPTTKAIGIYPENALAYANRGLAYEAKDDIDRAIADYSKTIELDEAKRVRYHDSYSKSIELYPEFDKAYNNRGAAYLAKGDFDRAITDYNKVIEINPGYAVAYANRGVAHQAKGDLNIANCRLHQGHRDQSETGHRLLQARQGL